MQWKFDPPLTIPVYYYLDNDKERIPEEELGMAKSNHLNVELPPGIISAFYEDSLESVTIDIPHPVRKLTIDKESEESFKRRTSDT